MNNKISVQRHSGFSLIELLVGVIITILAAMAIMVSVSVFENRKRTTTSGSDAQVNAMFGLYVLEREIRNAGYGFAAGVGDTTPVGCALSGAFNNFPPAIPPAPGAKQNSLNFANNTAIANPITNGIMAPILITNDANGIGIGGTDAIRIMSGNTAVVVPFEAQMVTASTAQVTALGQGLNTTDTILLLDSAARTCALRQITTICDGSAACWTQGLPAANGGNMPATINPPVTLTFGATSPYNNTAVSPNPASVSHVLSLGNFRITTFSTIGTAGTNGAGIQNSNTLYQFVGATSANAPTQFELAPDIVNIQAQYGLDTNQADGVTAVTQWLDPTAANGLDPASLEAASAVVANVSPFAQIKAIRIALVARSALLERSINGSPCNAPSQDQPMGTAILRTNGLLEFNWLDGTLGQADVRPSDLANWGCYRYQVSQSVIPLRSVIWSTVK